jgi:hypothetical protein
MAVSTFLMPKTPAFRPIVGTTSPARPRSHVGTAIGRRPSELKTRQKTGPRAAIRSVAQVRVQQAVFYCCGRTCAIDAGARSASAGLCKGALEASAPRRTRREKLARPSALRRFRSTQACTKGKCAFRRSGAMIARCVTSAGNGRLYHGASEAKPRTKAAKDRLAGSRCSRSFPGAHRRRIRSAGTNHRSTVTFPFSGP